MELRRLRYINNCRLAKWLTTLEQEEASALLLVGLRTNAPAEEMQLLICPREGLDPTDVTQLLRCAVNLLERDGG